ncbi:MAG: cytochrome c biogenesis protein ResB [Propionibacteriaceae bacterium]|jgi:cytochrome c biogenesis protein|nr:cytochrome c biogenesis protein ResB [Propionibacteriaceae bacterium]
MASTSTDQLPPAADQSAPEPGTAATGGTAPGSSPEAEPGENQGIGYLFLRIYQFFYSKTVGLIIILVMAVYVLIGVIVVQEPASARTSESAKEAFLAQATEKYGGWTNIFDALGFFHLFSSIGFLVVAGALAASIIACTVHRIPLLWRSWKHPKTSASLGFFDRARYRGTVLLGGNSADQGLAAAKKILSSAGYRVQPASKGNGLYAAKHAWGPFGTVAAHASFIIIMAALLISASGGIDEVIAVPVDGEPVAIGHGTDLRLQATAFENVTNAEGRSLDYVSTLHLFDGDTEVAVKDIRVNSPLRYEGINFHQNSFGMAADVTVTDASGATLFDQAVALTMSSNDGLYTIGQFNLNDWLVNILLPASGTAGQGGLEAGQAAFQLVDANDMAVDMGVADQGQPIVLQELNFTFGREREYTGIGVRQDHGSTWMWIGSFLLVVGMTMTFAFRPRRIWVRPGAAADGRSALRFGSSDKLDTAFGRQFQSLVRQVAGSLPTTASATGSAAPSPAADSSDTTTSVDTDDTGATAEVSPTGDAVASSNGLTDNDKE